MSCKTIIEMSQRKITKYGITPMMCVHDTTQCHDECYKFCPMTRLNKPCIVFKDGKAVIGDDCIGCNICKQKCPKGAAGPIITIKLPSDSEKTK